MAAKVVIYKAHFYTFSRFSFQYLYDLFTYDIILKNIILKMYIRSGALQSIEHCIEFIFPVQQERYSIQAQQ